LQSRHRFYFNHTQYLWIIRWIFDRCWYSTCKLLSCAETLYYPGIQSHSVGC
jgi:hypothetical protein